MSVDKYLKKPMNCLYLETPKVELYIGYNSEN